MDQELADSESWSLVASRQLVGRERQTVNEL